MIKYLCDFCNKEIENSDDTKYISIYSNSATYYKRMMCERCKEKFYDKIIEFRKEAEKI